MTVSKVFSPKQIWASRKKCKSNSLPSFLVARLNGMAEAWKQPIRTLLKNKVSVTCTSMQSLSYFLRHSKIFTLKKALLKRWCKLLVKPEMMCLTDQNRPPTEKLKKQKKCKLILLMIMKFSITKVLVKMRCSNQCHRNKRQVQLISRIKLKRS